MFLPYELVKGPGAHPLRQGGQLSRLLATAMLK
jgi:hypothetical protein